MKGSARHPRGIAMAAVTAGGAAWLLAFVLVVGSDVRGRAQTPAYSQDEADYGYGNRKLTDAERAGRDTWYFWTGGNEKFWVKMAELTEGNVNLLAYVDSRLHGRRFTTLGAITQPGCRAATAPDQYGLWMDQCEQPVVPGVPGDPIGHRRAAAISQSEVRQGQLERRGLLQASGEDRAALPHRDGVRVLPRRLQSALPARESRSAEMVEPRRRDRQPVLGGRAALQPADAADRFPLARRQPAAAGDLRYVALRDRPHQQSQRDQLGLQPRLPADRSPRRWPTGRRGRCTTSSRMARIRLAWPARRFASTSTSACAPTTG